MGLEVEVAEMGLVPLDVTYDKLTILGDLKNEIHITHCMALLEDVGFVKQDYESRNYGFKEVYKHDKYGYIEFSDKVTSKEPDYLRLNKYLSRIKRERELIQEHGPLEHLPSIEELNSAMDETLELLKQCDERGFLKRMKDIRFEYNPKYGKYGDNKENVADIQASVIGMMQNKHCTQIHLAMDYHVAMKDLLFLDKRPRSECIFRDKNKRNETLYLGDRSSREYLCFYDKTAEVRNKGTLNQYPDLNKVSRFEARLKGSKIDAFAERDLNPFDGVAVYSYTGNDLSELDCEQELIVIGILEKLKRGLDPFAGMTKYKKNKYRQMIDNLLKLKINLADDFRQEKSRLAKELNDILKDKRH